MGTGIHIPHIALGRQNRHALGQSAEVEEKGIGCHAMERETPYFLSFLSPTINWH